MQKKHNNIVIVNGINYWNIGDLGITDSMVALFRKKFPDADMSILTPYSNWVKPSKTCLESVVTEVPDLFLFPSKETMDSFFPKLTFFIGLCLKFIRITFYFFIYRLFNVRLRWLLTSVERKAVQVYESADVVISKGGGFLFDHGRFVISPHAFPLIIARVLKKPVVIYAQSVGPFKRSMSKNIYKKIFSKMDVIIVREKESQELLKSMGISSVLGMDAAFTLPQTNNKEEKEVINLKVGAARKSHKMTIGGSLLEWHFPYHKKEKVAVLYTNYITAYAETVSYLKEKYNAFFYFFPHSVDGLEKDDRAAIKKMIGMSKLEKSDYEIVDGQHNPRILSYFLGQLDICIGSRMHSNIFTLLGGTPLVAISYLPKTRGIMSLFGLEKNVCEIDTVTYTELRNLTENVLQEKDALREYISRKAEDVAYEAEQNSSYLLEYLQTESS